MQSSAYASKTTSLVLLANATIVTLGFKHAWRANVKRALHVATARRLNTLSTPAYHLVIHFDTCCTAGPLRSNPPLASSQVAIV